jgi:Uma2 family endonuclease
MTTVPHHHRYTYAEYVAWEPVWSEKHEFCDGEIFLLARGTDEHSVLAVAMSAALLNAVGHRPCRVASSDLRIYVESVGLATYPDASVIRGPLQQHEPSPKSTALNPSILVEVTSDSSEEYDNGTKLEYYKTIPSLREYLIVSHHERRITVHLRESGGAWTTRVATPGERVVVPSLNAELSVDEIYRNSTVS